MSTGDTVSRILASEHVRLLLNDSHTAASDLADEIRRRSRSRVRRVASLAAKAALLYALASVCCTLLFGQYPALWQLMQNSNEFSRAELQLNHLVRQATVSLGLHKSELLQAREREQCLVPNPLYKRPLRCCPCGKLQVAVARSGESIRNGFERLYSRMVTPFAYANNSQPDLSFQELSDILATDWEAVTAGSNRLSLLWPPEATAAGESAGSVERLFLDGTDGTAAKSPPPGRAIAWLFGHLPAIRLLRQAVRRPNHVPEFAEDVFARQFIFLGDGLPADESVPLGDLETVRGLAFAFSLYGEVSVSLALKPECCPAEVGQPDYRNQTRRLGSGDVLSFMSDCYWLSLAKAKTSGYAIVYIGSVFNGIHPTESSAASSKK